MKIDQEFPKLNTVIFDLGNVIINLDIPATDRAFKKLMGDNFDSAMAELNKKNTFQEYEKGNISTKSFIEAISLASKITEEQAIKNAWNAMLLDIPQKRFELLNEVKKKYRTFCLSNTNELHIEFIYKQLVRENNLPNLNPFFEKVYLSHEMGMRKPDEEIFSKVIDENQLNPSLCLFIDDTAGHLEGAKKTGLNTLHLSNGLTIEQFF